MGCGQMIAGIQRIASLTFLVDLDTMLSGLCMEKGGIMGRRQRFEVGAERWAHLVENLAA